MKTLLSILALAGLSTSLIHAQEAKPELTQTVTTADLPADQTPGMKPVPFPMSGMKGSYEMVEAPIEKVYSAEHDGFTFKAYVVKWHDQEVVVSNMMGGASDKKAGDKLNFMAQEIEFPIAGKPLKMIQFMAMDTDAMGKLGADYLKSLQSPSPSPASDTEKKAP